MTLECANRSAGEKLQWFKDNVALHTALAGSEEVMKLDNETGTMVFLKSADVLHGNYSCKGSNSSTEYRIVRKYPIPS